MVPVEERSKEETSDATPALVKVKSLTDLLGGPMPEKKAKRKKTIVKSGQSGQIHMATSDSGQSGDDDSEGSSSDHRGIGSRQKSMKSEKSGKGTRLTVTTSEKSTTISRTTLSVSKVVLRHGSAASKSASIEGSTMGKTMSMRLRAATDIVRGRKRDGSADVSDSKESSKSGDVSRSRSLFASKVGKTDSHVGGLSMKAFGKLVFLPKKLISFDDRRITSLVLDDCVHRLLDIYETFLSLRGANTWNISGRSRLAAFDKLGIFLIDDDHLQDETLPRHSMAVSGMGLEDDSDEVHKSAQELRDSMEAKREKKKKKRDIDVENETLQNVFDALPALDGVLDQVLSVLRHDSFQRFLLSPEFGSWHTAQSKL
jgi:hypothetical protein